MAYFRCTGNSGGSLKLRTAQGEIASFETNLAELLHSVTVNVVATGGNGTPDNPNPINGYTEANIVNTQNDSIVDLFSIDSDFRGTVAFNQICKALATGNWAAIGTGATLTFSDGVATFTPTAQYQRFLFTPSSVVNGHKYLLSTEFKGYTGLTSFIFGIGTPSTFSTQNCFMSISPTDNNWHTYSTVKSFTSGTDDKVIFQDNTGTGTSEIKNAIIVDLTAMFGSTIADYIYTLEQNNAGEGVAFFRNIYPEDYYAYDSGTTEIVGKETPEATIAFGQTVYGGVLDVTRGKLHVTHANIASYNGESINEPWLSSMDTYVPNTTPTTGAQVVYPLTTPFDIDLTPVQIRALVGENNVFADCGKTEVEYLEVE